MGLDLEWNKGPRDFSKFASCNLKEIISIKIYSPMHKKIVRHGPFDILGGGGGGLEFFSGPRNFFRTILEQD